MKKLHVALLLGTILMGAAACSDSDDSSTGTTPDGGGSAGSGGSTADGGGSAGSGGSTADGGGSAGSAGGTSSGACSASSPAPGEAKGSCLVMGVVCQEYTGSQWTQELMGQVCNHPSVKGTLSTTGCDKSKSKSICQNKCGSADEFVMYNYTLAQTQEACEADGKGKWIAP